MAHKLFLLAISCQGDTSSTCSTNGSINCHIFDSVDNIVTCLLLTLFCEYIKSIIFSKYSSKGNAHSFNIHFEYFNGERQHLSIYLRYTTKQL